MINDLVIKLETLTPLFLGGADQEKAAELRVPSIKGQLRFWYRATDPDYRRYEARLFGSTDAGQSGVMLSLRGANLPTQAKGEVWRESALAYLGYGPVIYEKGQKAPVTQRSYIKPGAMYEMQCRFRPWLNRDDRMRIIRALKAWTLFGGLGSRSRRGFGSLQVQQLGDEWAGPPATLDELETRCRECLNLVSTSSGLPDLTAFSSRSVIKLVPIPNNPPDWRPALQWTGEKLRQFRSCRGNTNPRFQLDHDLFYDVISGTDPGRCPERHVFGLPHNYFTPKNGQRKMDVMAEQVIGIDEQGKERVKPIERRASPLFIRIHRLKSGEYVALLAFLPSQYLPSDSRLVMTSSNGYLFKHTLVQNWLPITEFLSKFDRIPGVRAICLGSPL